MEVLVDLVEAENVEKNMIASEKKLKWHAIAEEYAARNGISLATKLDLGDLIKALQSAWTNEK